MWVGESVSILISRKTRTSKEFVKLTGICSVLALTKQEVLEGRWRTAKFLRFWGLKWGNLGSRGCGQPCLRAWACARNGSFRDSTGADQQWGQGWRVPASDTRGPPSQHQQLCWWPLPVQGLFLCEGYGRVPWEPRGSCLRGPWSCLLAPLARSFRPRSQLSLPFLWGLIPQQFTWATVQLSSPDT